MRILVAEDERDLLEITVKRLKAEGYGVDGCANGEDAAYYLEHTAYDLAILDIMMPGKDGLTILRELRRRGSSLPVLLLTALDAIGDRVEGLDAGADDYLAKPFDASELLARLRALARGRSGGYGAVVRCGDAALDTGARVLTGPKGRCEVSGREAALLAFLFRNAGQVLPRALLLDRVWGADSEVEEGNLNNYIFFARRRLQQVGSRVQIQTVRGLGYRAGEC